MKPQPISQINVGNTTRCNMACDYCYNEQPRKTQRGSETRTKLVPDQMLKSISDVLKQLSSSETCKVVLIGGEPLLDWTAIQQVITQSKTTFPDRAIHFTIYTNGTLLSLQRLRFLRSSGVQIVVSCDGPPEINDLKRHFGSGRESSRTLFPKLALLNSNYPSRLTRVTCVLHASSPRMASIHEFLCTLGFVNIHVQPEYSANGILPLDAEQIAELHEWYLAKLSKGLVLNATSVTDNLKIIDANRHGKEKRLPCDSGLGMVGLGPDGHYYPCHHYFGEDSERLNNVELGLPSSEVRQSLFSETDARPVCASCSVKNFCGGECYHRADTALGSKFGAEETFCNNMKLLQEMTAQLYIRLELEHSWAIERILRNDFSLHSSDCSMSCI